MDSIRKGDLKKLSSEATVTVAVTRDTWLKRYVPLLLLFLGMDADDVISVSDSSGNENHTRISLLGPVVQHVVDALGGFNQDSPPVYVPGDSALHCLRDLKTLWRKDDTDDERSVARLFKRVNLLSNDLIPILHVMGPEDKLAIAAADLICAMTWPVDLAEELRELDYEWDKSADFTELAHAHLGYKSALLQTNVLDALFAILLPPLALSHRERTPRSQQIASVILHIIRNLAFIRDLPPTAQGTSEQARYSSLQGLYIARLRDVCAFDLLLAIAVNEERDSWFEGWNTLVLEILYLLFREVNPTTLARDQSNASVFSFASLGSCLLVDKAPKENLNRLLFLEESRRLNTARTAASRHSRFGTTISVTLNTAFQRKARSAYENESTEDTRYGSSLVLHRQAGLTVPAGKIMDIKKKTKFRSLRAVEVDSTAGSDGLGDRSDNLGLQGRTLLREVALAFMNCLNAFLLSLLKDIKAERPKITEQDNMRLMFITKWFLSFFLESRDQHRADANKSTINMENWQFGNVAEVIEKNWISWVLRRMRAAVEEKPKLWAELQVGNECLTQLLLVLSAMSDTRSLDLESDEAERLSDAAAALSSQIIYNGEVLDIAVESLRSYRPGTQSLGYLESAVNLAWAVFKMLERWGKEQIGGLKGEMYVRKKKRARRKRRGGDEEHAIMDNEEEEEIDRERMINETMFKFEEYEMKFANYDITNTLLAYLSRYKQFASIEPMKRVVNLLHRQAVRAKAEGLFFNPSTLILFQSILMDKKSIPKDQAYEDLFSLITYIIRQFFKSVNEEPFLIVQAFYPKNRNNWKQFSSWEPEVKVKRGQKDESFVFNEVYVKKGYSWSEQVGIVIAALVQADQKELIDWVVEILQLVSHQRKRIIDNIDKNNSEDEDTERHSEDAARAEALHEPSAKAKEQMTDYLIPYVSDEQGNAATKNHEFRLLLRLLEFSILDADAEEIEWFVPASILPRQLQANHNIIAKFLETPINLDGKAASTLLSKKRHRRGRRTSPSSEDKDDSQGNPDSDSEGTQQKKRQRKEKKEKKKREEVKYKSAQFIEDSDAEYGDMEAFLENELKLRARQEAAAANGDQVALSVPKTKKRVRNKGERNKGTKKRKGEQDKADTRSSDSDNPVPIKPRPKPKPIRKKQAMSPQPTSAALESQTPEDKPSGRNSYLSGSDEGPALTFKRKPRVMISDDDDNE